MSCWCPNPSYPIHAFGFLMAGGVIRSVPAEPGPEFFVALERAIAHSIPKPIAVVVCYPSNPTAMVASLDFYRDLVLFAKKHEIFVLSDIAYAEVYFEDEPPPSILQAPGAFEVAVEFTSMSKTFSMAGWRMGFAVGNERLLAALARVKSYLDYGAYTPIQVAAAAALNGPDDCVREMRATYKRRRDVMIESFAAAGWAIDKPSASMFAWTPVPERFRHLGSLEFSKLLIEKADVAVAPGRRLRRARRRLRAPRAGRERATHPPGRARRSALLRNGGRDAAQCGEAQEAGVRGRVSPALAQLQLIQPEREDLRRDQGRDPVGGAEIAGIAIAVRRGLSEHPRRQSNRVDHPKLANAEAGVERRLAAGIVAERGIGDLDDEQDIVRARQASMPLVRG